LDDIASVADDDVFGTFIPSQIASPAGAARPPNKARPNPALGVRVGTDGRVIDPQRIQLPN
jgi:hypothetical protein